MPSCQHAPWSSTSGSSRRANVTTTAVLNASATVVHTSKLPESVSPADAIAMLHDHEFFLACEPHMSKFERLASSTPPPPPPAVPGRIVRVGRTECFTVTDVVSTLPAGLWDSSVVSTYEFTDTPDGVFVRIKSPLSVVMDTVWTVRAAGDGTLELVEDVSIRCSRLLLGVVKSTFEGGWRAIHAKMIARLEDASLHATEQLRV